MSGNEAIKVQITSCSIQLSYTFLQMWWDSNPRPTVPEVTSIYTTDRMILEKTNMIVNHCFISDTGKNKKMTARKSRCFIPFSLYLRYDNTLF